MNIIKVGSNLWDEDYALGFWGANGSFSPNTTGYLSSANHIRVNPNTKYRFVNGGNTSFYICYYEEDKTFIRRDTLAYPSQSEITTPANCYYVNFSTYQNYGTVYNNDISLNYPSSDTSYHSHIKEVKTISWESEAGTVYSGTLNVTTGELIVNSKYVTFNSLTWYTNNLNGAQQFYSVLDDSVVPPNNNTVLSGLYCDSYLVVAANTVYTDTSVGNKVSINTGNALQIRDYSVTTLEDFKEKSKNFVLVYPLANPEVYQLSPEEVKTLLGVNNIYADTGNVSVTYRADVDLYIAKKIAEGA